MRIRYDTEADVLLMLLSEEPPVDAVEEPGGVIVSYGEDGDPVSVEVLEASSRRFLQDGAFRVTVETGPGRGP